uniref:Ig-like domain-containing protein n=1 Tax=Junco hyemalis TaxID=40217 RepID=A0A8C5NU60_JUNHY
MVRGLQVSPGCHLQGPQGLWVCCALWVTSCVARAWVPLSGVSLSVQPPGGQVTLGDSLVLSCEVAIGTDPLSFSWHQEGSGALLGTSPHLELHNAGDNDSGQNQCRVSDGDSVAESDLLNVTVLGEWDAWAGGDPTHGTAIPPAKSVAF